MDWKEELSIHEMKVVEELKLRTYNEMSPTLREDDSVFYRFSKARDFKLPEAEEMLKKHIVWRKENKMDDILNWKVPEVLLKYIPETFLCYDKEGSTVRFVDFGGIDFKGLFKSVRVSDMVKYLVYLVEKDIELMKLRNEKLGKYPIRGIYIHNHQKMTLRKATDRKLIEVGYHLGKIFQDNYPERVKTSFEINASLAFKMVFSVMKPIIAPALLEKFKVYTPGDPQLREDLLNMIDADELPATLGGNKTGKDDPLCENRFLCEQTIPTEYYSCNSEKRLSSLPDVQRLRVQPRSKTVVNCEVEEEGSFLVWEFETDSRNIEFAVARIEEDSTTVQIIPQNRMDTEIEPEKGMCKCEKRGSYSLVFDNSYSWLRAKDVYYRVQIKSAKEVENC